MVSARNSADSARSRRPPATTPEARENQLIALAFDLAEKQLIEGTASAQVTSHFLKLGSTRERDERQKLRSENKLLEARVQQMDSSQKTEELYRDALNAMRAYSGHEGDIDDED